MMSGPSLVTYITYIKCLLVAPIIFFLSVFIFFSL